MIYEVRDFCCGLLDREACMISQNKGGLPIFLADLGIAVKDGIERYGLHGFAPGDVVIMNHGRVCGQHLNNVVIYAPCFHGGEVVAFAASRAHWVDIGGMQFRSLKIFEAGKRNETLWQMINDNLRFPEAALGDLRAQVACCALGVRRFSELLDRYGRGTVEASIEAIWDATDREVRAFVAKIPDGTYEAESFLDNDGRALDIALRIKVKVIIAGDRMIIDFSELNDQVPGPTNSGYSGGLAAARVAFKNLTQPEAPVNEGCFRALELILPEGKILNAKWPAALGLWSIPLPTVIDTILKALASALPERIPAAHKGDMGGCSIGGYRGDRRRFLLMNIFGGGWGGRPHEDGESAAVSICQGDVRSAPIELQELQYPFLIEEFALRIDSGGAGQHRGGLGVEMTYSALQDAVANVNCERTKDPPWGLHGGRPGAVNEAVVTRADGKSEKLRKATGVALASGDRLTFRTAGGGGWGDPRRRSRTEIDRDIAAGYVSREAAMRDYGYAPARENAGE
jgi:N-methylhydantoinase B